MTFGRPEFVWLGAAVALLMGLALAVLARRRGRLARFLGGRAAAARLSAANLYRFPWERLALLGLAALALGAAAGDPNWETALDEPPPPPEFQVMIAIDVSASMQATDVGRTRLAAAVEAARRVVVAEGERKVGLVLFAGEPYLLSPPTADRAVLEYFLSGIAPTIASAYDPGTRLTVALEAALAAFEEKETIGALAPNVIRSIVVVTDGDSNETEAEVVASAEALAGAGITVHFASVGSDRGGTMIMPRGQYQIGGQIMSPGGGPAVSRPRPRILESAAAAGGGSHVPFDVDDPEALARAVVGSAAREETRAGSAISQALDPASADPVRPREPGSDSDAGRTFVTRAIDAVARAVAGLDPVGWLVTAAFAALLLESLLDARWPRLTRIPRRRAA